MSPEKNPGLQPSSQAEQKAKQEFLARRGINTKTYEFLKFCLTHDLHLNLPLRQRNLIGIYYGSNSSLEVLLDIGQTNNKQTVSNQIKSGMLSMWRDLPQDVKQVFPSQETLLLKNARSKEIRRKWSESHCKLWGNPQYRTMMNEAKSTGRAKKRADNNLLKYKNQHSIS